MRFGFHTGYNPASKIHLRRTGMKNVIQKIFITLVGLIISFAACIIGMYMVFLADMKFVYQMLFSAIFMFNPITTILMAVNMFKRPKAGAPSTEKWEAKADRDEKREAKAAREVKKPKEVRNPFKKEPRESGSSKKDEDFSDVLEKDRDDYESDIFSSDHEIPDPDKDDDIFSSHITVDEDDQFISE